MEERTTNRKSKNQKGFSVFVGGTYVGYLTIREFDNNDRRTLDETTAARLQDEETFAQLMKNGAVTVQGYKDREAGKIDFNDLLSEGVVPKAAEG